MALKNMEAWLNEARLQRLFRRLECRDAEQAKLFVQFALACVKETPVGGGLTTVALLTDPRSLNAVDVVDRWLLNIAGRSELNRAEDAAEAVAMAEVGPRITTVTGKAAALWSVAFLAEAAVTAAEVTDSQEDFIPVEGQEEDDATRAAQAAIMAASMARRAASDTGEAAARYQWELAQRLWPTEQQSRGERQGGGK